MMDPLSPQVDLCQRPDLTQLRVLVVDDEPMLRSVIQEFLRMIGIEQHYVAGDGEEALEMLRRFGQDQPIDCMLSDIRMPRMELDELLEVINREFPGLIVIATSGYSDLNYAHHIFNRGAHDFLGKPLNLDALEQSLGWIAQRRMILGEATRLFGSHNAADSAEEAAARLARFEAMLAGLAGPFQALIDHAVRMGRLARRLETALAAPAQADLAVACMLHEIGSSYQMFDLCRQPRRLEEDERRVIHAHGPISGRMTATALARPEFADVISDHFFWHRMLGANTGAPADQRICLWLGILNSIDGWLHDRPDRPAITLAQLRQRFERRQAEAPSEPVSCLLDQWGTVETLEGREAQEETR